jgi:hypothetical protein
VNKNELLQFQHLSKLLGNWTTEATHPAMPGLVVHGTTSFEWLEGAKFLISRSRTDHPQFPDAISIIGNMNEDRIDESGEAPSANVGDDSMKMHYFDSRGVFRINGVRVDEKTWQWWRDAPGFSQQFTGTFADDGDTIVGLALLRRDDMNWKDDLRITYRREQ